MTASPPTLHQLVQALSSSGFPTPSLTFLTPIINPPNNQRLPPLPALLATTKHRLLSADLTQAHILDPSKTAPLPPSLTDISIPSSVLPHDTPVQVLNILDLGKSQWEQIEALEAERKGEYTKGREIIRIPLPAAADGEQGSASQAAGPLVSAAAAAAETRSSGPFKLLLQDRLGMCVYGVEIRRVEKVAMPTPAGGTFCIGCKIMLKKGARVARGLVLLEPEKVVVLGGKIDALDKSWREGREQSLRAELRGRDEEELDDE